jgi:hypothetical protein
MCDKMWLLICNIIQQFYINNQCNIYLSRVKIELYIFIKFNSIIHLKAISDQNIHPMYKMSS